MGGIDLGEEQYDVPSLQAQASIQKKHSPREREGDRENQ